MQVNNSSTQVNHSTQTLNEELFGKFERIAGGEQDANPRVNAGIAAPNASSKAEISTNKAAIKAEAEAQASAVELKGKDEKYDIHVNVAQAKVGAEAELGPTGASAGVKAGLNLVDAHAAGFGGKLGLSADTEAGIGLGGVKLKVAGTGIEIGKKMSISAFGNEVSWEPAKTFHALIG